MGHQIRHSTRRRGSGRIAGSKRRENFQPGRNRAEGGQAGNLIHVEIAGLRNNRGQVYCRLFQSARNFPSNSDGNAASTASTITNRRAACDFENQDPGSYAILVFHDEDSTHVLELNPNGTPREGVGLSNNPSALSGLPSYDAAKFPYRTGTLNLTINMQYPSTPVSDAARSFSPAPTPTPA